MITYQAEISSIPNFLDTEAADELLEYMSTNIKWHTNPRVINPKEGKPDTMVLKRKMAYVYERPLEYQYANAAFMGETWAEYPKLDSLRNLVCGVLNKSFNSVLLNLYRDGKDKINWHSDKEVQLGPDPYIACLNFGATRKFWFQEKAGSGARFHVPVSHGDLLIMDHNCQKKWLHAILPEAVVVGTRISLTFRWVYDELFGQSETEAEAGI